jgi:Nif-specific regulatory protein
MKSYIERIRSLAETLAALLGHEALSCQKSVLDLLESVRVLRGDTADLRLQSLSTELKKLEQRVALLSRMAHQDFLTPLLGELEGLEKTQGEKRLADVMMSLANTHAVSLNSFCEVLLDQVIEATGAERGFILFYSPESTEADVVAARNFRTTNLSLGEYHFSRTLLHEVFEGTAPLLLEDASHHPSFSGEESIAAFQLKSVLAAPLREDHRTIGALYLENNSVPCAFNAEDSRFLEQVSQFALFYLRHAHLLPVLFEPDRHVFFDTRKASQEIIGRDPRTLKLLELVEQLADSPATILIEGESGTGKELVARALHFRSRRRDHPFVAICCAAIPENLMESELFGHEKGAFTGASEQYIGRIEQGDGGTIFLDEVSELAYPLQAKLLRFLQSNELQRLGGKDAIRVDVRIVAATSKNLREMVKAGTFQDALFYRLSVIPVSVPPLRERKPDIALLVDHFLEKFNVIYRKKVGMEREVYDCLREYPFPGNVRELENLVHRLVALSSENTIHMSDLPKEILQIDARRISLLKNPLQRVLQSPLTDLEDLENRKQEIKRRTAELQRELAERTLREANGNLTEAARRLGMHRITLHRILRKSPRTSQH